MVIDYNDLERAYQEVAYGHAEPDVGCALGSALKFIAEKSGSRITRDKNGDLIKDDKWYWMSAEGIFPVVEPR